MALVVLLLPLLFGLCVTVGTAIGSFDRLVAVLRADERLAFFFWLGLGVLAIAAETVSLFAPVRPWQLGLAGAGALGLALARRSARAELVATARLLRTHAHGWRGPVAIGAALLGVAVTHCIRTTYFDTLHYHYQAIQWFATFGAVPGLGLLHVRLGFGSSWMAFLAAFDAGPATGRLANLGSALVLFVSLLSWALVTARCLGAKAERSDHFWAFIVPALLAQPWVGWQLNSASPDLPATFAGAALVWLVIALADRRQAWISVRAHPRLGDGLALLALACGAGAMKLSAIVLPVVGGVLWLLTFRPRPARLLAGAALGAALLGPGLALGVRTTGAPLFPMTLLAGTGPSALTEQEAADIAHAIRAYAYLGDNPLAPPADPAGVARAAVKHLGIPYVVGFPTMILLAAVATTILLRRSSRSAATWWTLAFAWSGILFWLTAAPNLRFGALFLTLVPALLVADDRSRAGATLPMLPVLALVGALVSFRLSYVHFLRWLPAYPIFLCAWVLVAHRLGLGAGRAQVAAGAPVETGAAIGERGRGPGAPGLLALASVVAAFTLYLREPGDSFRKHLVRPATLGSSRFRVVRSHDVVYQLAAEQCRATRLPCAQEWNDPARLGIRLRDPGLGLGGGFARTLGATTVSAGGSR